MRTIDTDLMDDRLVVSPRAARRLLDTGNTRLYELLAAGELDSYRDGRSRLQLNRYVVSCADVSPMSSAQPAKRKAALYGQVRALHKPRAARLA
jgi:hypothetical protein